MFEELFERFFLQIKSMGALFLIPFIGYFSLIPLGVWALSFDPEFVLCDAISEMCYLFVPFLSTWWLYLMLKEYVEGDGREVLLLGKTTIFSAVMFWILNMLCILPLLWVEVEYMYQYYIDNLMIELLIIIFFMNGLTYFLNYFTKSITVSMFIVILYTALSNYTFRNEQFSKVLGSVQLSVLQDVPYEDNMNGYIKFIFVGLVFWILGFFKSRKVD